MGELQYPNKRKVKGPWLLNRDDLESLHEIIEKIDKLLRKSWDHEIEADVKKDLADKPTPKDFDELVKKRKDWISNNHEKSCDIYSNKDYKLSDETLLGVLKTSALQDFSPNQLRVSIIHGSLFDHKFDLRVSRLYDGELSYEIKAFDPDIISEIQYLIDKWIDQNKPNKPLQFWSNNSYFSIIFLVPLIIFSLLVLFSNEEIYTTYSNHLDLETHQLINKGIDSTNINRAVEILLQKNSNYVPDDFKPLKIAPEPVNSTSLKIIVIGWFIMFAAYFRPKTTIGIGKKSGQFKVYKFWTKFVLITVPTALILAPLWSWFKSWLY